MNISRESRDLYEKRDDSGRNGLIQFLQENSRQWGRKGRQNVSNFRAARSTSSGGESDSTVS